MSKQFEQIKILYNQILVTSSEVKALIEKENYDEAISREGHKTQLVKKVSFLTKQLQFTEEEKKEINSIKEKILAQEAEVLEGLQNLKTGVGLKLKTAQKQAKLSSFYDKEEPTEGSICDYTSD